MGREQNTFEARQRWEFHLARTLLLRQEHGIPIRTILSQGVPFHLLPYAIEGGFVVQKGKMHRLLFLAMLLEQKGHAGINRVTTS